MFRKLYKGYFDKTIDKLETEQIGILHLDCNLYSSTILSLEKRKKIQKYKFLNKYFIIKE